MYETINSPINYGGLELKNRIIFAPTTFGLAEDEYFEKIRKIAAGGCAMVIIGDVPVGKSQFEKSLFDKKGFAYYQKLAEIVHSYDCRICAQLHQTDSNMLAMLKYVPGVLTKKISMEELRPLLNAEVAPYISKLSTRKIHKIINGFGEAAVLAVKAGFDMVQVHGDRMCGSFSSTVFNHRTDEYGGGRQSHPQPSAGDSHRLQAGRPAGRSPLWQCRCAGVRAGYFCTAADRCRCDQLPCNAGEPFQSGGHHSPGQPPVLQRAGLLPEILR